MSDMAARIAELPPEKRELLLRQLSRLRQGEAPPPPPLPTVAPRPDERWEPFPLTEIQEVYWAGRSGYFDLGAPGVTAYFEFHVRGGGEPFLARFEKGLERTLERHDILRLRMLPDGRQQLVENLPPFRIERVDLKGLDPATVEARLEETRERFRYHEAPIGRWPLFGMRAHFLDGNALQLHIWFDCWLLDGLSRDTLVRDMFQALGSPDQPLPRTELTYRDYAVTWEAIRRSDAYRRAREHWLSRIPDLPPPPELPLAEPLSPRVRSRLLTRFGRILSPEDWQSFREEAARRGLTPSTPLIAAFLEVLRAWSRNPRYALSLEGTYWPPIHPRIRAIVGNFNTLYLVAAGDVSGTFAERCRRLQAQLTDILDHRTFSGFEVLREINRRRGGSPRALMPVLFNSLIEFNHKSYRGAAPPTPPPPDPAAPPGQDLEVITVEQGGRPPQLLLMPTILEGEGQSLGWAFRSVEEAFLPGVTEGIEKAYVDYIGRLFREPALWDAPPPCLTPAAQLARRKPHPGGDLGQRLGLTSGDRVLALEPRELLEGLPESDGPRASVWSGAPARIEQLVARLEREGESAAPLLVLLWGGTVPVTLPDRLRALSPGVRILALRSFPEAGPALAALHEIGEVPADAVRIPLGRPLPDCTLEVLDERLEPRPDFVPGALYAGTGGTRVPTGQLARFLPDGSLELLGREDEYTVDLFGYPAEPRRTEAAMERLPGVRAAAVRPVPDARGRRRLAAWVVPAAGTAPDGDALRSALAETLPAYLVPWRIRFLPELPLDAAGEVDSAALPADFAPEPPPPPPGELEAGLARMWAGLLGIEPPGPQDNFFELGGTSFTAVLLLGRLQEQHGTVDLSPFFFDPTIAHLAGILRSQTDRGAQP